MVRNSSLLICVGLAAVLSAGTAAFSASTYTDGPTSTWFKALASTYEKNCCDQADCKLAQADYREDGWWAKSNRTGAWVPIPADRITHDANGHEVVSIFKDAILCEGDPRLTVANVYCFAPPPLGF
jgi:hypothetical protein